MELSQIERIGVRNLNELQLSLLYQYKCIWHRYKGSYDEFIEEKHTKYNNPTIGEYTYVTSHAAELLTAFKDGFRKDYIKPMVYVNAIKPPAKYKLCLK